MKFFPFSRFIVHGQSMLPNLKPGENVITFNWYYFFKKPKAEEMVVIKLKGKHMIKRIQKTTGRTKNEIFVLGDNETQSTDSRSFGWINKSQIIGKVIYTFS